MMDGGLTSFMAPENILAKAIGQGESQPVAGEKHDLLARLLGRLAHEIRNPLSSLDIHVQLLEEDLAALAPETRKPLNPGLEIIHGELHRLESIVERFLRLAGPSALDLEPVKIPKIVAHVCDLLRAEASTREIEITSQIENNLPSVTADSVRLTQALMNLVINAVQAVEKNGRVRGERSQISRPASRWFCGCKTTGLAFRPTNWTEIFDPYFTTKPEGIGLGLWIAQQIAVAHGGTLRTENAPAGGAIFTLLLPLSRKENPGG